MEAVWILQCAFVRGKSMWRTSGGQINAWADPTPRRNPSHAMGTALSLGHVRVSYIGAINTFRVGSVDHALTEDDPVEIPNPRTFQIDITARLSASCHAGARSRGGMSRHPLPENVPAANPLLVAVAPGCCPYVPRHVLVRDASGPQGTGRPFWSNYVYHGRLDGRQAPPE